MLLLIINSRDRINVRVNRNSIDEDTFLIGNVALPGVGIKKYDKVKLIK